MTAYIFQRLVWLVVVLFAVATVTFVLMHSVEGGPWDRQKGLSDDAKANLNRAYGLDDPLWQQFGLYLYHLAQGDLGISIKEEPNRPVTAILADKIPVSAQLGLLALAISVGVGMTLGVASALRRNSIVDYAAVAFATVGGSVPSFVLGMLLMVLFTGQLHWLPYGEWGSPKHAVMPALALSAWPAAYIARVARASMLDVLDQEYVRTARAKGLIETVIVLRHTLRNALIPILTVIGPIAAVLVTGTFIVEELFNVPGMGRLFVSSIKERDYGIIMGATLFYTVVVAIANLAVDLLYAAIDPRIRYEAYG
jgi:oligopeptide transport system permease protein